jgi:hypothetical protein
MWLKYSGGILGSGSHCVSVPEDIEKCIVRKRDKIFIY